MTKMIPVDQLVPHSGGMSLLNEITDYGDDWLQAKVNITSQSVFVNEYGVPSWVGIEYMAQAVAAYSGLQERRMGATPKIGFLLGARKYICSGPRFDLGTSLQIKVTCALDADNGMSVFDCEISSDDVSAHSQLNVFQPPDGEAFLQGANL